MTNKGGIHYGWVVVVAGVLTLALGQGMLGSTNSVFVVPVCEALGVSRSSFTFHRTILTLVSCCVTPFFGKLIQRFGVRRIMLTGAVFLGLINFCYSFAQSLMHFYVLAFFNGLFSNMLSFMVVGILIGNWFAEGKGLATGIAYSGSGIGGAVMIPVVTSVVENFDWRMGYRVIGAVGFVTLSAVALLLVRDLPQDKGLAPCTSGKKKSVSAEKPAFDLSLGEVLRTSRFWLLAASFLFIACFAAATNTHSTPFLIDLGYPSETVSAVISLFMIFLTVGKIILGFLYDKLGSLVSAVFIGVCCIVFPVAALLSGNMPFPWLYAVFVGIASCAFSTPMPILVTRYFGTKDYPTILSIFSTVTSLGSSFSVPLMGAVYDNTGSYGPAWYALLGLSCVIAFGLVACELSYRRKAKAR
ncbi:MAG: MFS transporter [Clostridia bacterium]|nr:MFS transporter [Clostridia bacterium]